MNNRPPRFIVANDDDEPEDDALYPSHDDGMEGDASDDDEDSSVAADDVDALRAIARLAQLAGGIDWFGACGQPLQRADIALLNEYCAAIGVFDPQIDRPDGWQALSDIIREPDWDAELWQTEEQAMQALMESLAERDVSEHDLLVALNHAGTRATEAVREKLEGLMDAAGFADDDLLEAGIQAAMQATQQAALVLAAQALLGDALEADGQHPFALKFRLFERGHWPLGLVGGSYRIF
ncbi:hypothetical protein [Ferrovibrio sp.]|uniref:hypothetical protein n=1 Tax=Ferrovibrio sp. TaxID=1917215 RepID=UPI0025B9779F|nr:hypothetical protein [Ferrovibrio sp.]MBX3453519.1 hypothetical protein [Ferrovibrio sp.]